MTTFANETRSSSSWSGQSASSSSFDNGTRSSSSFANQAVSTSGFTNNSPSLGGELLLESGYAVITELGFYVLLESASSDLGSSWSNLNVS